MKIVRRLLAASFLLGLVLGLGVGVVLVLVELRAVDVAVHSLVWPVVVSFGLCLPGGIFAVGALIAQARREAHTD